MLLLAGMFCTAASNGIKPGEQLLNMELKSPSEEHYRSYLGLGDKDIFTLSQLNCKVVIVEIFSMYCPYCQKEAPVINTMYERLENDPVFKGQVKLVGIGAGNTPFEVDFFQKNYGIAFPLFPDGDFTIHKALGEVRTPYFIGYKKLSDGSSKLFLSRPGRIEDMNGFLERIIQQLD